MNVHINASVAVQLSPMYLFGQEASFEVTIRTLAEPRHARWSPIHSQDTKFISLALKLILEFPISQI